MDSLLVLIIIIVGILFATGLWKDVFRGIFGGIIKFVMALLVILLILAFLYYKLIA